MAKNQRKSNKSNKSSSASKPGKKPQPTTATLSAVSASQTDHVATNQAARLNPRAASFRFEPKEISSTATLSPSSQQQQSGNPTSTVPSYAAVAGHPPAPSAPVHVVAEPPVVESASTVPVEQAKSPKESNKAFGTTLDEGDQIRTHTFVAEDTTEEHSEPAPAPAPIPARAASLEAGPQLAAPGPAPEPIPAPPTQAPVSTSSIPTQSPALSSHIIPASTTTTTSVNHSTQPSVPSVLSDDGSSVSSDSSCCTLPSRRDFVRAHVLQYVLTALICLVFVMGVTLWKKEIRVAEFLLGMVAWLAGEQLKEIVFDTLRWPKDHGGTGSIRLEVDEEAQAGINVNDGVDRDGSPSSSRRRHRRSRSPGQRGLVLPTAVHSVVQELLRLGAIVCLVALLPDPVEPQPFVTTAKFVTMSPLPPPPPPRHRNRDGRHTLPPLDTLFFSALWMALGWAIVEIAWASRDMWQYIGMYEDVLEEEERRIAEAPMARETLGQDEEEEEDLIDLSHSTTEPVANGVDSHKHGLQQLTSSSTSPRLLNPGTFDREVANERSLSRERELFEEEVDARIRLAERDEIEAQLGVPLYEIPVAVVIVWRLDR